jgi:hypothetical protein
MAFRALPSALWMTQSLSGASDVAGDSERGKGAACGASHDAVPEVFGNRRFVAARKDRAGGGDPRV